MFEDLIKEKKKSVDKTKICPYCGSACITLYAIKLHTHNTYERAAQCNNCQKKWDIRYDRYMINAEIITGD